MKIREYRPEDAAQVQALYEKQQFGYALPDLSNPLFFIRLVLEDDAGKIVQTFFAHLTAECYVMMDHEEGTPEQRMQLLEQLAAVGESLAWNPGGLDEICAWVPPKLEKSFGKRLLGIGWRKSAWPCFAKVLKGGENAA